MAIAKWISFGTAQSTQPAPAPAAPPPPSVPVITAADAKHFGLENFGNTCYANSVLQALYFCGPFRELLEQYPDPSAPDIPAPPPSAQLPAPPPLPAPPASPAPGRHKASRKFSLSESAHPPPSAPPAARTVPAPPIPAAPPTLLSALRSLFLHISKNPADRGTIAPRAFIEKLREVNELFRGSMHQDAHEFLNFLLNRIVEEMEEERRSSVVANGAANGNVNGHGHANGHSSGEDLSTSVTTLSSAPPAITPSASTTYHSTFIHRLFEGVLTSETRCLTCETVSSRDESFLDLSIDIEQNSSVTACLRQFSASEMLCQKNKFFCDSCCDLQEAEKRMKIKKLPNVLALHLKRFKYQEDLGKYIKLAYRVAFPMELRLFNTVDDAEDPDRLYALFAIVVHIGNGPHHGHYVTLIKARGTWLLFDDDNVETVKEADIQKYFGESNAGSAYVLYYQAVDLDMAALGIRPPPMPPSAPSTASTDIGSVPPSTAAVDAEEQDSPPLPPGLTMEDTPSEKSESPAPATPASHLPPPLSLLSPPAPPAPALMIPSAPGSPVAMTPDAATPTSGRVGGLFNSLRHVPSIKVRPTSSSGNRRSIVDPGSPPPPMPARRPTTATGAPEHAAPLSPRASASGLSDRESQASSEREKEKKRGPEKKSSTWFRRRTTRLEASLSSPGERPQTADAAPGWLRASPTLQPLSVPSSPVAGAPLPARSLADHKRSTPDLARGKSHSSGGVGSGGKLPKRPSTAPRPYASAPAPPVPPMPAMTSTTPGAPLVQNGAGSANGEGRASAYGEGSVPGSPALMATSASTATTASGGSGDAPITSTILKKKATRKLSLTAPILGFGRRDKEKDRREAPPTSFSMR